MQKIPSSAVKELIDGYQHKIISLEVDLKQLQAQNLISHSAQIKRLNLLHQLKKKIKSLQALHVKTIHEDACYFKLAEIPSPQQCSHQERAILGRYLSEVKGFVASLKQDSHSVIYWIQSALKGRIFKFLTRFDLAKLRKKLISVECKLEHIKSKSSEWETHAYQTLKSCEKLLPGHKFNCTEGLKHAFFRLEELNNKSRTLKAQIEKEEAELNWMEHWISFQEFRIDHKQNDPSFAQEQADSPRKKGFLWKT